MQARLQDSVTGRVEGRNKFREGTKSLFMWIWECGSNDHGEDKKKSLVQQFPQPLVFITKFLRFSTISKVENKKIKVFVPKVLWNSVWVQKTKKKQFLLTNSRGLSTNLGVLGLDLHSQ